MLGWLRRQVRLKPGLRNTQRYKPELAAADGLRDNGNFAAAAEQYRAAIRLGCTDPMVRKQLANMLKDSGNFTEAEAEYQLCLSANPDDADTLLQMGHLYKLSRRPNAAIERFEAALARDPLNQDAARELAILGAGESAGAPVPKLGKGSLEERITAIEHDHRALRLDLEAVREALRQSMGWSPEDRVLVDTMRNQWNAFIPLMVNMSSTIAALDSKMDELDRRSHHEAANLCDSGRTRERPGSTDEPDTETAPPDHLSNATYSSGLAAGGPQWTAAGDAPMAAQNGIQRAAAGVEKAGVEKESALER